MLRCKIICHWQVHSKYSRKVFKDRNETVQFAERWMDLGIVKQREVRKRKTSILHQCIHVESRENGADEPIHCKAEMETQM